MHVRLLLGPAGSGKTFRCLSEAQQILLASPEGLPLLLVAPKQGTYQLEQQLLSNPALAGYTRLEIVSFEALARAAFERLGQPVPQTLSEEGRVMVLRALLAQKRQDLRVFRASARLTGFAQQLSSLLSELQRHQLTPANLNQLAAQLPESTGLPYKLQDLATLLRQYLDWLAAHQLQDQEALLSDAAALLQLDASRTWRIGNLWVDGFAEFSQLELELLCALLPRCEQATVTFCLEAAAPKKYSWLSHWSLICRSFESCQKKFGALPGVTLVTEALPGQGSAGRFSKAPALRHLEQNWGEPRPYEAPPGAENPDSSAGLNLRLLSAADREGEVLLAAREVLTAVRAGLRYRDVSVVVRKLELYQQPIQRVFSRLGIPFFLDRRESVSHHPLAELTRGAMRAAALGWQHADWFAALKSGLVPVEDEEIDLLENEALARGWKGRVWREAIHLKEPGKTEQDRERLEGLATRLERIRSAVVPPFEKFSLALAGVNYRPSGEELAAAVRALWMGLQIQQRLERWAAAEQGQAGSLAGLSVHETVWRQMNTWLDNAQLAFPRERLALREWLPILEAGLANLTVGIIPPALDQVLVGAIDRSRTPEVQLALVLGLNETVFPAAPDPGGLLTESDRLELEKQDVLLGASVRRQVGRERYLAYIACTRPRRRLVLSWSARDSSGGPLNPSSLISHVRQLFPQLLSAEWGMRSAEWTLAPEDLSLGPSCAEALPSIPPSALPTPHSGFPTPHSLAPDLAAQLYGPVLRTSVSRLEQFAACPFRFFVHSGLRAEERRLFDLDAKEQGSFQHDVLAQFHNQLAAEGKRWRDITPREARERVAQIARSLSATFRDGLLESNEQTRFTARVLAESLQDFVEILVDWMRRQYRFDPVKVELPFGEEGGIPAWSLELDGDKRLELHGRIDRVDLHREPDSDSALCVVVDYKSSQKQLDPVLIEHGLQLQLLAYLNVLRHSPGPMAGLGLARLEPAGVFYVNLRGKYGREPNRRAALADPDQARKLAYRHTGRFDQSALPLLDSRTDATEGDQFNYRRNRDGELNKRCSEPVSPEQFVALLEQVENNLIAMGRQIYSGCVEVRPIRKGIFTACDQCVYQSICRIDPWTHSFRLLRPARKEGCHDTPLAQPDAS